MCKHPPALCPRQASYLHFPRETSRATDPVTRLSSGCLSVCSNTALRSTRESQGPPQVPESTELMQHGDHAAR